MDKILVDSNIILDLLTNDPVWADYSKSKLSELEKQYDLIINSIIYSEISIGFETQIEIDNILLQLGLKFEKIPKSSLFRAGKAFLEYRRNCGKRISTLPDFFIGAHAETMGYKLLTRDKKKYITYFPEVSLILP